MQKEVGEKEKTTDTSSSQEQTPNISEVADVLKSTIPNSILSRLSHTNKELNRRFQKECEDDFRPSTIASECDRGYSFQSSDSNPIIKGNILCQIRQNDYFDKRVLVQFTVDEEDVQTFSTRVIEPLLCTQTFHCNCISYKQKTKM